MFAKMLSKIVKKEVEKARNSPVSRSIDLVSVHLRLLPTVDEQYVDNTLDL